MIHFGIDLGGTKIEIIALDDKGKELLRIRKATPNNPDLKSNYIEIINTIKLLITDAELKTGEGTVGICTPGAVSPHTGLVKNSNTVCLNGMPLKQDLEIALKKQVRIANDANCFALSEAVDGAANNANIVFGVIIGTGVGGGLVINKQLVIGANAIAGEWGHNPMPWSVTDEIPGMPCYCGKSGCIETFLSGPALLRHHLHHNSHNNLHNQETSSEEIVLKAQQGDNVCEASLKRYERQLARGLAHIINLIDPDVIVLGGGMSNVKRLYKNVPKIWGDFVFSDHVSTRLLPPVFGDSSGVRGAAWLWMR